MIYDRQPERAMQFVMQHAGVEGAHHLDWVIDQAVRIWLGPEYDETIAAWQSGPDGPGTFEWREGIAP